MSSSHKTKSCCHFDGKKAIDHVIEAQAKGLIAGTESHGTEIPGHISAAADGARETALFLLIFWIFFATYGVSTTETVQLLAVSALAWAFWKGGRSAWLAWSRLERMHRIVEQEKWEIEHHRPQEREELTELYRTKGLEGKLLESVIDVLMADDERLLRIMVEEELCLSLESHEHPIKQTLGALIGTFSATAIFLLSVVFFPEYGGWFGTAIALACGSYLSAQYEGNRPIPAIIWNLGLGALTGGAAYFLRAYIAR